MRKRPLTFRELLRRDWPAMLIGSALGLTLAGYFVVYVPMKANHDKCGRVTICSKPFPIDSR